MIPEANPTTRLAVKICFVLLDFEKWKRTNGRTDDTCENSDHYHPCVSRPSESIEEFYPLDKAILTPLGLWDSSEKYQSTSEVSKYSRSIKVFQKYQSIPEVSKYFRSIKVLQKYQSTSEVSKYFRKYFRSIKVLQQFLVSSFFLRNFTFFSVLCSSLFSGFCSFSPHRLSLFLSSTGCKFRKNTFQDFIVMMKRKFQMT